MQRCVPDDGRVAIGTDEVREGYRAGGEQVLEAPGDTWRAHRADVQE